MIIVRLEGGLGNSMFQYALGRRFALNNAAALKFDIESYATNPLADCSFWLESFNIDIRNNCASPCDIKRLKRYRRRKGKQWLLYNIFSADRARYVQEKHYHFDPWVHTVSGDDLYLHGWWQSEKYFLDIRDTLLRDFTLRNPLPEAQRTIAQDIGATDAIAIHIRRLDYVTNSKTRSYHGELPKEYYYEALAHITALVPNPKLFIFSDDIGRVREEFTFPYPCVYVQNTNDITGASDMHLMSLCKHAIIANSSFSWWGAWLNRNPKKIVIAPTPWVAATNKQDSKDVVPDSWVTIRARYIRS